MKRTFDPRDVMDAVVLPMFTTSTFSAPSAKELKRRFEVLTGKRKPTGREHCMYARFGTPNSEALEGMLIQAEPGASSALVFPSGMSAITTLVLALVKPGSVIVHTNPVYGCTQLFFSDVCGKLGITCIPVDTSDLDATKHVINQHSRQIAMLFIETPANPSMRMSDIANLVTIARGHGAKRGAVATVMDNTFMGPVFQHPLTLGADFSVYSCTKFIGGHSDLTGGAVMSADAKRMQAVKTMRDVLGPSISPFTCWQMTRSLETLEVRMRRQAETAVDVAQFLSKHPKVRDVRYPGLMNNDDDQDLIYQKQCTGGGSMISFTLKGGGEKACFRLLDRLRVFTLAVSLGGTESLAVHPRSTTHLAVPPELLEAGGVTNSLIRLSIGLEEHRELIRDLSRALKAV